MPTPRVFVSYSWDSDEHRVWVRDVAVRLRNDGIETILDQWEVAPGDQLPAFMERSVRESDFVLIVCTPKYRDRSNRRYGGVGYEGDVITAEIFSLVSRRKFIPILRHSKWAESAPSWLAGSMYVDLSGDPYPEERYRELLDTLHGRRETAPPVVSRFDGSQRIRPLAASPENPPQSQQAARAPRFELLDDPEPASSNALTLLRRLPCPTPFREVVVRQAPKPATKLFEHGTIGRAALECQVWTAHNHPMFPMLDLMASPMREPQGLLWTVDTPGYGLRFALGFDGSFAYSEWMRETQYPNPVWGTGVGLFTCLDRLMGSIVFARKLSEQKSVLSRAQVVLTLQGVAGLPLGFDFDPRDGRVRNIQLDSRYFQCARETVCVGGEFDPGMDDADIESFAAGVGGALTYFFGWDWKDGVTKTELHNILDNARNW